MSGSGEAIVEALSNKYNDRLVSGLEQDDDDILAELEAFDDSGYRAQRIQQLSQQIKSAREVSLDHGKLTDVDDEAQVLKITTTTNKVVAHFYHNDFSKCRVMDRHFKILATRHLHTRFIRINAQACPFLVTRLKIQVLPCVIPFIDGVGRDRILGFEGLNLRDGGDATEDFPTLALEMRLQRTGVIERIRGEDTAVMSKGLLGFPEQEETDDSDSE